MTLTKSDLAAIKSAKKHTTQLSPEVRGLCQVARLSDVAALRDRYRHILRGEDLKWLDRLLEARRRSGGQPEEAPSAE